MSDSDPFDGLAEHVVRHLGPARRRWTPPGDEPGFGVTLHYPTGTPVPVVSAVTTGLRLHPLSAPRPVELVCTLRTGQEPEALHLVYAAARHLLSADPAPRAVVGQLLGGDAPLVPDTAIHGLLFGVHPLAREVAVFRNADGEPVLSYLTLLPLTRADLRHLTEGDEGRARQDRLWRRWRADKVAFWDVRRPG